MIGLFNQYTQGFSNTNSLLFDGVDEYIDCGNDASLNFERTDSFSISAWVYITNESTKRAIVSNQETDGVVRGYQFFVDESEFVRFGLTSTSTNALVMASTTSLTTSQWNHVVVTYNGSSDPSGVKIYINNVSDTLTTVTNTLTTTTISTSNFNIGARDGKNNYMDGYEDEVSVWGDELTSGEVSEIYNSNCPGNLNSHSAIGDLISWWRMGEGDTIASITDQISSNDGTPINMEAGDITTLTPC